MMSFFLKRKKKDDDEAEKKKKDFHESHEKVVALLEECDIKGKVKKKLKLARFSTRLMGLSCWLVFGQPTHVDEFDLKQATMLLNVHLSILFRSNDLSPIEGTASLRYNLLYNGISNVLDITLESLEKLTIATKHQEKIEKMLKDAKELNFEFDVNECY